MVRKFTKLFSTLVAFTMAFTPMNVLANESNVNDDTVFENYVSDSYYDALASYESATQISDTEEAADEIAASVVDDSFGKLKAELTVVEETPVDNVESETFGASVTAGLSTLKNYILAYGGTNSSGNKVISQSYQDYTYGIIYNSSYNYFEMIWLDNSTNRAAVNLKIDASTGSVIDDIEFIFASSNASFEGYATFPIAAYNDEYNLVFYSKTGSALASAYNNLCNAGVQLACTLWDALLQTKVSIKLSDIGFLSWGNDGSTTPDDPAEYIDEVEPNSSIGTATKLTLGVGCRGEIGSYAKYRVDGVDVDWYSIELVAGNRYQVWLEDYNEEFASKSLIVKLFTPTDEIGLSYQMKRSGENYYEFSATTTGTYYVKLYNYFDNKTKTEHPYVITFKEPPVPAENPANVGINVNSADRFGLKATLSISNSNVNNFEFSWYAQKQGEDGWIEIQGWTPGNAAVKWTPDVFGNYTVVGKVRSKGHPETEQSALCNFEYHPQIKGKCQMPYSGEQGVGYLIGVESFENPNQSYRYEMLILDCTLLAQGLPAWTYTTGQFTVPQGNAGWCVWTPQYGYYWTLFRVYDENGVMLDEQCYGFANVC